MRRELESSDFALKQEQKVTLDLVEPLPSKLIEILVESERQCQLNTNLTIYMKVKSKVKGQTFIVSLNETNQDGFFITSKSSILVDFKKKDSQTDGNGQETASIQFEVYSYKTGLFKLPDISVRSLTGRCVSLL